MSKTTARSIGAVLAGFVFILVTHTGTDAILKALGALPKDDLFVSSWIILIVIGYRAIWSVIGSYLTARLAPHHPLWHALALGLVGMVLSTVGAILAADLGPPWYAWTLVAIALPVSWLGGTLAIGPETDDDAQSSPPSAPSSPVPPPPPPVPLP